MKCKYVMFDDDSYLIFPESVPHDHVEIYRKKPVSAGFITMEIVTKSKIDIYTYGNSLSLKLESRENDANILRKSLTYPYGN